MTPQEQKLVADLFDRLATLESAPRDEGAVDAINAGLDRAPNALYPLVQSVLVQDEALKRADARIRELEAELGIEPEQPPQQQDRKSTRLNSSHSQISYAVFCLKKKKKKRKRQYSED